MNKVLNFVNKERLYLLILVFVLLFNAIMFLSPEKAEKVKKAKAGQELSQDLFARRPDIEESLRKNGPLMLLFGMATMLILAMLMLGTSLDFIIFSSLLSKKFDIRSLSPPAAKWTIWDLCKVIILFLFFGYILIIAEAFWARIFPILKSDNIRMIINTTILDILAVVFIINLSIVQYKENLEALGLSVKNFFKNVFYGIVGYIALLPVLAVILAVTAIIISITKYVPERQPVVEMFLKEKDVAFLTYSSFFAAVLGPIVEELFFRGFMYNALKKYTGVLWSVVITAAIFATLHSHVVGFLPIMALGILLAFLYEKTGTLVSSMTVHITHNLSMVFLVFLIKQAGVV
ncbi:MAG: type II CAAX endopeptidase family protein [Candidatus Omnitrophota bacterium]|nr:type II CAAX endopeptidase family protein [Candidatus Omnitrophota bacterium]